MIGAVGPAGARGPGGREPGRRRRAGALPFRTGRAVHVGEAPVFAQRITYVGELGFELYVEPAWAVRAWDLLLAAGDGSTGSSRPATACSTRSGWRRDTATPAPT